MYVPTRRLNARLPDTGWIHIGDPVLSTTTGPGPVAGVRKTWPAAARKPGVITEMSGLERSGRERKLREPGAVDGGGVPCTEAASSALDPAPQ